MSKSVADLRAKIARLVEERGWNLDEFARQAGLHRLTVRGIFRRTPRRLHNATVAACARALGFSVYDLREEPLADLLERLQAVSSISGVVAGSGVVARSPDSATQPECGTVGRPCHNECHNEEVERPRQNEEARQAYEEATQPELLAWLENNRERANQLSPLEWDELLSLQGTGGPLTAQGVAHFVGIIERKRRLIEKVQSIAGTEYLDLLERLVELLHEKIQPYRDRR